MSLIFLLFIRPTIRTDGINGSLAIKWFYVVNGLINCHSASRLVIDKICSGQCSHLIAVAIIATPMCVLMTTDFQLSIMLRKNDIFARNGLS